MTPKKAAFKLHSGLYHNGLLPVFAEVTKRLESEMAVVDTFRFPAGSVLVSDRGYGRHTWHKQLSYRGVFWVTRARSNMDYVVLKEHPVKSSGGVLRDQLIKLNGAKARRSGL